MRILTVDSLSYTYPGADSPALSGVSFDVDEGDYLAIVGANGSGKSTLLRCLNGLIAPPPGTVSVCGNDPATPAGRAAARRSMSMVFQSPPDQIVASVVEEDVAFGLENLGIPRPEMRIRVTKALDSVGLSGERARAPGFLSAGQQQRLAVAGALAMGSRLVAFDEATSMIDPLGRADVLALVDGLVARGITVIHVTHDMDEAARARRVAVLSDGRVVFTGSPAALFASDRLAEYRLRRPRSYMAALALGLEPIAGEGAFALGRRAAGILGTSAMNVAATAGLLPSGGEVLAVDDGHPGDGNRETEAGGQPAFSLRDASMTYLAGTESERLAVDKVTLDVEQGSVVALVGRTGSGKSSLLQLLDGLALPDSGTVLSFGVGTADPHADLRVVRMRAPLAVQRPESAIFEVYAGDEVAFGPRNQGLSGLSLVERVRDAMDAVGLPFDEYRDLPARTLSGGRKRRLAIASILSLAPDALLLDEPTSALDPASRTEILDMIRTYAGTRKTVVMSTHSMDEAALADAVAVMDGGSAVAFGPPGRIFGPDWNPRWGIERPFSWELGAGIAAAATSVTDAACVRGSL